MFQIADPEPIAFTAYLRAISRHRVGVHRAFVPIPTAIVVPLTGVMSRLLRATRVDLRRLLSLLQLRRMETVNDNMALGVNPRRLDTGLVDHGQRRRDLIREGRTLLRYFLGRAPSRALTARYVRAVEHIDGGVALRLRAILHGVPALLILVEGPRFVRATEAPLQRRFDIAFQLAEASTVTAQFMLDRPMTMPLAVLSMTTNAALELLAWVLRPVCSRLLYADGDRSAESR